MDRDESLLVEMERLLALDPNTSNDNNNNSGTYDDRGGRRTPRGDRSSPPSSQRGGDSSSRSRSGGRVRDAAWRAELEEAMRLGAKAKKRPASPPSSRESTPRQGRGGRSGSPEGSRRDYRSHRDHRDASPPRSTSSSSGGGRRGEPLSRDAPRDRSRDRDRGASSSSSSSVNSRPAEREDGSWDCPSCGNHNYASRQSCNMKICGAPKPASLSSAPPNSAQGRGGRRSPSPRGGRDDRDRSVLYN